ncbi:uncharacterized protein LOC121379372 [Gigantopelta aegis]|uniref:uncharacterized protein LOC121379372 n=1 Tax=Gigantopelta aegis TaxID=1735272 RepID=UPI001B887477|nr:uncharacterized protein LOC121379372 [Gigantopelta aegis]
MTDPLKPVVVELHPNLTVQRNPGHVQNVTVIIDAEGHLKVLPEIPSAEVGETQSSGDDKTCQDLCKTEQFSMCQQQLVVNNNQNFEDNLWIKKEPIDTYDSPPGGDTADCDNIPEYRNSGEVNQWIKNEPVDIIDRKPDLNSINNYHSTDDDLYGQQNDEVESNCLGERIYLPYNTKLVETDEETDSLPDAVDPILSEDELKPKRKYAVLTLSSGERMAIPVLNVPGNQHAFQRFTSDSNKNVLDWNSNAAVHPCILKKNIWATENGLTVASSFTKSNCQRQEEKMMCYWRLPPRKKPVSVTALLNRHKNCLKVAIMKKKSNLEKKIQQEVNMEVNNIIREHEFLKREDEKRQRLHESDSQFCSICKNPIDETGLYVDCDLCSSWFHGSCVGITNMKLQVIEAFLCNECKEQQDSTYQQLHCICKTPLDDGKFYVGCDQCQGWFHGSCVGVTEKMAKRIDSYTCPHCLSRKKTTKRKHYLNDCDYERLWDLVCNLQNHKMAKTLKATNVTAENPNGALIETQTIDLSLVERRLVLKHYETLSEFVHDMTTMFHNCRLKNPSESAVYQCAEILESFFVQKLKSLKIK